MITTVLRKVAHPRLAQRWFSSASKYENPERLTLLENVINIGGNMLL